MKKITFFLSALVLTFLSYGQTEANLQGENNPVFYNTPESKAYACDYSNPTNSFENGRGCSASDTWTAANDLLVAADEDFLLKEIKAEIWLEVGSQITSVDVFYYADNAGLPGTVIGSQTGLIPTSQPVIGNNFGWDIAEVTLDVIPFGFMGQSGSPKTYWIGLSTYNNATGDARNFWGVTSATAVGNPLAFEDGTGYTIPEATEDGVYTFSGTCIETCDYFNPTNAFEGGRGCSPNMGWLAANDLVVNANENYILDQITVNIWESSGASITNVDVTYYDDNAGLPDNQIGFQIGLVPTSQTVIGTSSSYDIHEVVLDITPFTFNGQVSIPTTYWIGLSVTNSNGTNNYWEYNSASSEGNMLAFNNNGAGWGIPNATQDGVYIFSGVCQGLGIADAVIDGFSMYPNPVEDVLTIEATNTVKIVSIYNMLGQEVINTSQTQIDMSNLPTGSYVVKVQAGDQIGSYNLIKQ